MVLFRHESLFTIFKSVEIIVADELASCIEKDALGFKTLTLRVHHDLTTMEKRKKKLKSYNDMSVILLCQVCRDGEPRVHGHPRQSMGGACILFHSRAVMRIRIK